MGIDVNGNAVSRTAFYPGVNKPQIPLWFGWDSSDVEVADAAFRPRTVASGERAMLLITAKPALALISPQSAATRQAETRTVEMGLWYRTTPNP
jgi:hypothetical protein